MAAPDKNRPGESSGDGKRNGAGGDQKAGNEFRKWVQAEKTQKYVSIRKRLLNDEALMDSLAK